MILKFILWILQKRYKWFSLVIVDGKRLLSQSKGKLTVVETGVVCEAIGEIHGDLIGILRRDLDIFKVEAGITE